MFVHKRMCTVCTCVDTLVGEQRRSMRMCKRLYNVCRRNKIRLDETGIDEMSIRRTGTNPFFQTGETKLLLIRLPSAIVV